ncbi:MAG TPA: putative metallopeptidase [Gemmatimonadaceae bacterium]|nr:putative metallopeptidase [Gemmatimonadaceae bacterium]
MPIPAMHVPDVLRGYERELAHALAAPMLYTWDESETYHNADQAQAIGELLVRVIHTHLINASIAYVFREKMKTRDRTVWGKASKASGEVQFFNAYDFVLKFNWLQWRGLSAMQKVALVDHELSHCGHEVDDQTGKDKWVMVSHDIEEFGAIVQRWGLWRPDLVPFAGAVVHAHQLGLFEGAPD